jgi:hypothetical protein
LRQRIAPKIKELIEATGLTYTADLPGPFDAKRVDFLFQASERQSVRATGSPCAYSVRLAMNAFTWKNWTIFL